MKLQELKPLTEQTAFLKIRCNTVCTNTKRYFFPLLKVCYGKFLLYGNLLNVQFIEKLTNFPMSKTNKKF